MLKGEKIFLRAIEPMDVNIIYQWENDTETWKASNTLTPFSKHLIEQYIKNSDNDIFAEKQMRMMICLHTGIPVGTIDLFDFDPKNLRVGVGILIAEKENRHKGYASESLRLLVNYCFSTLQLHQMYCNITVDNEESVKLFATLGFQICGIKKQWVKNNNQYIDEYLLQLISSK